MPTGHGSREPWTPRQDALLERFYPLGVDEALAVLPGRTAAALRERARKIGIAASTPAGLRQPAAGEDRDAILGLHDQGMGYIPIARMLGLDPSVVTNVVLFAECERAGFTPAARDAAGGLLAAEVERIRAYIREGLPNVEIQRRMAISASCVSHYRRRMKRDGEAVPAPGAGLRYSGARIPDDVRKQVEHHFMQGYGSAKVAELAGVAVNFAKRRRRDLVARLAARGECLPGCDITGRRVAVKEDARFITDQQKVDLLWLWMAGWPVAPAARHLSIGLSSAHAIVQKEKDAMVARSQSFPKALPPHRRPGLGRQPARKASPVPRRKPVRAPKAAFPALATPPVILAPQEAPPRPMLQPKPTPSAPPRKRLSFEEQLALVSAGKGRLVPAFKPTRAITDATLGGVGSSML